MNAQLLVLRSSISPVVTLTGLIIRQRWSGLCYSIGSIWQGSATELLEEGYCFDAPTIDFRDVALGLEETLKTYLSHTWTGLASG